MRKTYLKIAVAMLVLAISLGACAKTAPKQTNKVKTGACCPGTLALAKTAKKAPVTKKAPIAKKALAKAKPAPAQPKALPRLLDLGATTCIPCKMMTPILDELAKEYKGKLNVDFIDVRKDSAAVEKYGIQAIPTQIFFDAKGKELFRHQGFYAKADILKKFKELGIKL